MAGAGYDGVEARAFIARLGQLGIAGKGSGLRIAIALLVLVSALLTLRLVAWV